jgi:Ca2+-binding RTX toxin-like protein
MAEDISVAPGIYQPDPKNRFFIETESAPPTSNWVSSTQYEGYTGTSYYRWAVNSTISDRGVSTLKYSFNVEEAGKYIVSLRALRNGILEGRDVEGDNENDFWVRINGEPWIKFVFYGQFGEWTWGSALSGASNIQGSHIIPEQGGGKHDIIPSTYELATGINTIEISGRSNHAMLDRIHITKDQVNTDISKDESDRIYVSGEPPVVVDEIDDVQVSENGVETTINLFDVFEDADTADTDLDYAVTFNSKPGLVKADIDQNSGTLTLSYTPDVEGTADLTIQAKDPDGLAVSTGFMVTVDLPDPEPDPGEDTPDDTPDDTEDDNSGSGSNQGGSQNQDSPPVNDQSGSSDPIQKPSIIFGTAGKDRPLRGTQADDVIKALGGKDKVLGLSGDDDISGGGGKDVIKGNGGDDTLTGNGGKDKLVGGAGNDILSGDNGKDKLLGQAGDDELDGGRGRDIYKGGKGDDVFVLSKGAGFDLILDFERGDMIRMGSGIRPNRLEVDKVGRHIVLSDGNDRLGVLRNTPTFNRSFIEFE